uniref:PRX2C n=1 Tax=Arundo donax TaxID=35708 RepID=A0A0A9ET10_ARUDO
MELGLVHRQVIRSVADKFELD